MFTDFILNGQGHGPVANVLEGVRFDPGLLRPYVDRDGKKYATINTGKTKYNEKTGRDEPVFNKVLIKDLKDAGIESPVFNATTMRKQEWVHFDQRVNKEARARLRAWTDLSAANSIGGFNAMGSSTYEYEAMSDPGEAMQDMDGLTEERNDTPLFKLRSVPLPVTHGGFFFSSRTLAISRNKGMPLSTSMPEAVARRIGEKIERQLIGTIAGMEYGTVTAGPVAHDGLSKVYGYTNFPHTISFTGLSLPTGSNPDAIFADVLAMRDELYDNNMFGPFMIYTSKDWDQYLDNVFYVSGTGMGTTTGTSTTLRQMIKGIDGIQDVRRLDFFTTPFSMIMVQMTSDVCQAINGMDVTTVQWESHGGMRLNFKILAIQVPLLQADYQERCGILHAVAA